MLEITNLEKKSAKKQLMASVNITLHEGEIFAIVGEHQSGKSLLSKLILTLSRKTSGSIKIPGNKFLGAFIPREQFMPQETILAIIKDYCKINDRRCNMTQVKNILALFNMKHLLHTAVDRLTPSQIDQLKIALPLIVRTDILILDAPFDHLSVQDAQDLRVLLKKISNELKTAIIVTARNMAEIEEFCDTIAIIDDGMIIAIQTYNQMIAREMDQAKLGVTVAEPNYAAKIVEREFGVKTRLCGDQVIINMKPDQVQKVVDKLLEKHVTVFGANRVFRSLEHQYWEIINRQKKYY